MGGRASGADDPDPLVIAWVGIGMNHDQQNRTGQANQMPAHLARHDTIWNKQVQRIVPNALRQFERNAMLDPIRTGLNRIPFEPNKPLRKDIM